MLDEKYKKILETVLETFKSESEMYHKIFLKYVDLANETNDEALKTRYLDKAKEYHEISIALSCLKTKIDKDIGF